jgi:hypothetical protein
MSASAEQGSCRSLNARSDNQSRRTIREMPMPKAVLVVRATVADPAKREAFDRWYHEEHLPQAMAVFAAEAGWRGWSETDPAVHQATDRFADRAALARAIAPDNFKPLIDEFDRVWPGITRSREILTWAQELGQAM